MNTMQWTRKCICGKILSKNKEYCEECPRDYTNKKWLQNKYSEGKTLHKIANICKASYVTIWIWMKKHNIKRRRCGGDGGNKANHFNLTKEKKEFIEGLLLGDGCLTGRGTNAKSCYYAHGDKNKKYIVWLSSKFESFGIKGKIRKYKNKEAYGFKSLTYYEFYDIARNWYPNGKKQIPPDFNLSPIKLKNWYIGDGNYSRTPLIDSSIFSYDNLLKISNELNEKGIINTLNKFKDRKRIRISMKSITPFFNFILSEDKEIPSSYLYKFPKKVII